MASGQNGPVPDPASRRILSELRDIRVEMRDMRVEMREDRRRSDEERRRSDERFERMMRAFREDSLRRHVEVVKAFKDVRTVGLSIVKTLNRHTQILTRIDRRLGARGNGSPGPGNGRGL
jgi:hypothetical protein